MGGFAGMLQWFVRWIGLDGNVGGDACSVVESMIGSRTRFFSVVWVGYCGLACKTYRFCCGLVSLKAVRLDACFQNTHMLSRHAVC